VKEIRQILNEYDNERELRQIATDPRTNGERMVSIPRRFVLFLLGEAEHPNGLNFGETPGNTKPGQARRAYWWRKDLRAFMGAQ
jgi:hypothetical protein